MGVEGEGAHAVVEIGRADGRAALHRVHEGDPGAGGVGPHALDLGERGDIEGLDSLGRQTFDDPRRRVGLHRIEDVAGKALPEPASRYGQGAAPHQGDRALRRPLTDQVQGRMVRVQFT